MAFHIKGYGVTDIGLKRKINQDAFLLDDTLQLYVVADGMGGHRGGEVASQMAVETLQKFCQESSSLSPQNLLQQGINLACQKIHAESQTNEELNGMGTTVIAMLFAKDTVYIGQVGDSRAYLLQKGGVWQLTEDHSLLNEEIRAGRLSADEAENYKFKNVITRSVGYEGRVTVDVYRRRLKAGDRFLACTDGLSGLVTSDEIQKMIEKHGLEEGQKKLIQLANDRGGDDNITLVTVEVKLDPEKAE